MAGGSQGARSLATLAAGFLPVLFATWVLGAHGCASGDADTEEADTGGTTTGDTGGTGDGVVVKPDGDAAGKDTALVCPDSGALNTCSSATDVGMLAVGASKSITTSLPLAGGDRWYKVTFQQLDNPKVHPHIKLTATPPGTGDAGSPFVLAVMKSCAADVVHCGKEDGSAANPVTDFEMQYAADPDGGADGSPDPDSDLDPDAAGDALIPIEAGVSGTVYVRVYRPGGTPPSTCDTYKLEFSN